MDEDLMDFLFSKETNSDIKTTVSRDGFSYVSDSNVETIPLSYQVSSTLDTDKSVFQEAQDMTFIEE